MTQSEGIAAACREWSAHAQRFLLGRCRSPPSHPPSGYQEWQAKHPDAIHYPTVAFLLELDDEEAGQRPLEVIRGRSSARHSLYDDPPQMDLSGHTSNLGIKLFLDHMKETHRVQAQRRHYEYRPSRGHPGPPPRPARRRDRPMGPPQGPVQAPAGPNLAAGEVLTSPHPPARAAFQDQ